MSRYVVECDNAAAERVLTAMCDLPGVTVMVGGTTEKVTNGTHINCAICASPTPRDETERPIKGLGDLCATCAHASTKLKQQFHDAALKQYDEFKSQLPRMVMDLRAGFDAPTFYRGFE